MCGRFTQTKSVPELRERFKPDRVSAEVAPRYNIAPTDAVLAIVRGHEGRVLGELRWGLVPSWAPAGARMPHPINAKAETLATSRMFKHLLPTRRCLVLADGFYEWSGTPKDRKPVRARLRTGEPFAFAGLWNLWRDARDPAAPAIASCVIVTVPPNELIRPIHDRMPAILRPEDEERWLDPAVREPAALLSMLGPYPDDQMALDRVSPLVNDVRHQGPDCIVPLA